MEPEESYAIEEVADFSVCFIDYYHRFRKASGLEPFTELLFAFKKGASDAITRLSRDLNTTQ